MLDELLQRVRGHSPRILETDRQHPQAAVLVPLTRSDDPELVRTLRASGLSTHGGEVAFPGGRRDATDPDLAFTALREAEEEVGVRPSEVSVFGVLPPAHVAASNFDATAVVGWWPRPRPLVPHDVGEIAAVHDLPLPLLVDPAARSTARHPSGYTGPAFVVGDLYIWGFTAHLLAGLFELAGWDEAWDAGRFSEIPSRFLHGRR